MQGDLEVGKGVPFERIRRITGYLVGTLERFNNAKRAEEKDRVKHSGGRALSDRRGLIKEANWLAEQACQCSEAHK